MEQSELTRRDFLLSALVTGGVLAAGGTGYWLFRNHAGRDYDRARSETLLASITPGDSKDKLPNIVIILVDDLGYGDLSMYGGGDHPDIQPGQYGGRGGRFN